MGQPLRPCKNASSCDTTSIAPGNAASALSIACVDTKSEMVGRLIQQQQLRRIASPEHARQGRFQAFAAAERRQRQSDLIRAQLQLQAGAQEAPSRGVSSSSGCASDR